MSPRHGQLLARLLFVATLAGAVWLDGRSAPRPSAEGPEPGAPVGFRMEEVSAAAGVRFQHRGTRLDPRIANIEPHVAALGASVSIGDANGDGRPDLYATSTAFGTPNALFVNQGDGTFRELAAEAGVADCNVEGQGASMGSVWADADNDGDEDLLVYKWGHPQLFRNDGGLRFRDVTGEAGLRTWMNSNGATWFDYDRDGLLDLYLCGYFHERFDLWNLGTTRIMQESFEFADNGGTNRLFRNLGGLRFEDVTEQTGTGSTRWTMAAAAADFDGDGWLDLYTANDYGPEELYRNVEGRRFELVKGIGLGDDSKSGMCVALGDVAGEGRLSVYVTNISKEGFLFQGNNLRLSYLHEGGPFLNVAAGVSADCGWAWGAQFGDLDNDGWQDLFVANGFVSASPERDYWYGMSQVAGGAGLLFEDAANWPPMDDRSLSGYERSRVLHNLGHGVARFQDVAAAVGVSDRFDGRAVAMADLFGRGALDVVVANQNGPLLIYRTTVDPPRHWVAFELSGTTSNRDAIGAMVTVRDGAWAQVRVVDGGSGFASQNDRRLHFGLGDRARVPRVEIRWPSGHVQVLEDLAADEVHRVVEPRA